MAASDVAKTEERLVELFWLVHVYRKKIQKAMTVVALF